MTLFMLTLTLCALQLQVDLGTVLAVWVFLHPSILRKAIDWLHHHGFPDGFAGKGARLTLEQLQQLAKDMQSDAQNVKVLVQIVKQGHGDIVHVPAGWMHHVCNMRPCIKLA